MNAVNESTHLSDDSTKLPRQADRHLRYRLLGLLSLGVLLSVGTVLIRESAASSAHVRTSHLSIDFPGASDQVVSLSSIPDEYTSRLFSGYLPIQNGGEGFYFFAESQSETPEKDPVLLWINGGPGTSSLLGCFSENGPLIVNKDGKTLRVNDFSWNKNTNMLCIESPVGVGFSYNASGIYKSDDLAQAEDLYWMLQTFFDKFPWLRANDFIFTGESYAGMYVPTTAKRIVEGNQRGDAPIINLKKFAVGNGMNEFLFFSRVAYAHYHGLIGREQYESISEVCPNLLTQTTTPLNNLGQECVDAISDFWEGINEANINVYNIYHECVGGYNAGFDELIAELEGPLQPTPRPIEFAPSLCLDASELKSFFNLPEVRIALHTKEEVGRWSDDVVTSSVVLGYLSNRTEEEIAVITKNKALDYGQTLDTVITPVWKFLLDNGVKGVIYHGDVDIACDFLGGLWAVESLKLPREKPRAAWSIPNSDQLAGFYEDFGTIKYVTVKGAGHMVPTDKPAEAKAMLDRFILN